MERLQRTQKEATDDARLPARQQHSVPASASAAGHD